MTASSNQVKPTITVSGLNAMADTVNSRNWDLVERLRALRKRLDGSSLLVDPASSNKAEPCLKGILDRTADALESAGTSQNDLLREIELLEELVG